jgi:hypothetical protein
MYPLIFLGDYEMIAAVSAMGGMALFAFLAVALLVGAEVAVAIPLAVIRLLAAIWESLFPDGIGDVIHTVVVRLRLGRVRRKYARERVSLCG